MNIFLDTSVLYKDPFLSTNFYHELLEIVKEKEVGLFMSDIVLLEMERNFGKIVDEQISIQKKLFENISHYQIVHSNSVAIDRDASIKKMLHFYKLLVDEGQMTIINYNNDMLPEVVNRAVWKQKPFSEGKTEVKDALIWLSYSRFAEEKKLKDCILLSDNVSDFCDSEKLKKNIFEIHPDLQKDSSRFKIYKSPKELIVQEKDTLQFASQRFSAWLQEQDFNNSFLLELIEDGFRKEVERKIEREFEHLDTYDLFAKDYFVSGYVSPGYLEFFEVDEIDIAVFSDECLISGDLLINTEVEGFEYNSVRDPGEDQYRAVGEVNVLIVASFSFYYDRNELPRSFEIDNIEIERQ